MKMICVSDTHTLTSDLPPGDVLIHAGDFSGWGSKTEFDRFIGWLSQIKSNYRHILVVPGNHDRYLEFNTEDARAVLQEHGATLLLHSAVVIDGVKFYGFPTTLEFRHWYFMGSEELIETLASKIPADTDVLISHGPPFGLLDVSMQGVHCGSTSLLRRLDQLGPKIAMFGHIHEGGGSNTLFMAKGGKVVKVYNISSLDASYKPREKFYTEIDL